MAKQIGILKMTGTVCGVCFYCMDGIYYARAKSSLSAERVKYDAAFAATRFYATKMAAASKAAALLYRQLVPPNERSRERYREVVGMVLKSINGVEKDLPPLTDFENKQLQQQVAEMIIPGRDFMQFVNSASKK